MNANKTSNLIQFFSLLFAFLFLSGLCWVIYQIWLSFQNLDKQVSTSLVAGSVTILTATLTVVLGKYYERKKEIESHYRAKKTEIYDEFLLEVFKLFKKNSVGEKLEDNNLVEFMMEWQRKMILWGGQSVFVKYLEWMTNISSSPPSIRSMYLMEEFFIEIRKDLGQNSSSIPRGSIIRLMLKEPELFFELEKLNPNATLDDLATLEKEHKTNKA